MDIYQRLKHLGISLPAPPEPVANFVNVVMMPPLCFVSGQGPVDVSGHVRSGKVGVGVSVRDAYEDAKLVGINLLAVLHSALGDLNRISRVVKILGLVNAAPDFEDHPKVIDGCSDLFVSVFGEAGRHARSAVGVGSLPRQITVEIEAVVEVRT